MFMFPEPLGPVPDSQESMRFELVLYPHSGPRSGANNVNYWLFLTRIEQLYSISTVS